MGETPGEVVLSFTVEGFFVSYPKLAKFFLNCNLHCMAPFLTVFLVVDVF